MPSQINTHASSQKAIEKNIPISEHRIEELQKNHRVTLANTNEIFT
jgi:Na+/phosphate symporter